MNSIPDTPSRDSNASDLYLGIDVGGTTIKYGVCKNNGEIVARSSCPTESLVQPENVIRWGLRFASESISEIGENPKKLSGVGLAVPGVLDTSSWCLREVVNLPDWINRPLLELLQTETGLNCAVINDANAAALAEHNHRHLQGKSLALITLGTGIGCGLTIAEQELGGDHGCAGEVGHLTIDFTETAPICNCGRRGCLEAFAGAPAVVERAKNAFAKGDPETIPAILRKGDFDTRDLLEAAEQGSSTAQQVITDTGIYVGRAIGILGQVIDPAVVLLGGAMTFGGSLNQIGKCFLESIKKTVRESTLDQVGSQMTIDFASLGNTAGITGAALTAIRRGRES